MSYCPPNVHTRSWELGTSHRGVIMEGFIRQAWTCVAVCVYPLSSQANDDNPPPPPPPPPSIHNIVCVWQLFSEKWNWNPVKLKKKSPAASHVRSYSCPAPLQKTKKKPQTCERKWKKEAPKTNTRIRLDEMPWMQLWANICEIAFSRR